MDRTALNLNDRLNKDWNWAKMFILTRHLQADKYDSIGPLFWQVDCVPKYGVEPLDDLERL